MCDISENFSPEAACFSAINWQLKDAIDSRLLKCILAASNILCTPVSHEQHVMLSNQAHSRSCQSVGQIFPWTFFAGRGDEPLFFELNFETNLRQYVTSIWIWSQDFVNGKKIIFPELVLLFILYHPLAHGSKRGARAEGLIRRGYQSRRGWSPFTRVGAREKNFPCSWIIYICIYIYIYIYIYMRIYPMFPVTRERRVELRGLVCCWRNFTYVT